MRHFALVAALGLALPLAAAAQTDPFLEAGVPATTRVWSGPDYQRAAEVLTAGKVRSPSLPTRRAPLSCGAPPPWTISRSWATRACR